MVEELTELTNSFSELNSNVSHMSAAEERKYYGFYSDDSDHPALQDVRRLSEKWPYQLGASATN